MVDGFSRAAHDLRSGKFTTQCRSDSVMAKVVQERPCTRCIKRDIGHLCHDEPREPAKKNGKSDPLTPNIDGGPSGSLEQPSDKTLCVIEPPQAQESALNLAPSLSQTQLSSSTSAAAQNPTSSSTNQSCP